MKEDRRQRGFSNRKLLAAVAITALFLSGSAPTAAARTASERSNETMEQMQTQTVMVTVVDSNGDPIIGANVIEKGTTNGGITDLDGKIKLEVKPNAII